MIEIQKGLLLEEKQVNGKVLRYLHSEAGYCFKDLQSDADDEETPTLYYRYMALAISQSSWTHEQLNQRYVSVPIEADFEIV